MLDTVEILKAVESFTGERSETQREVARSWLGTRRTDEEGLGMLAYRARTVYWLTSEEQNTIAKEFMLRIHKGEEPVKVLWGELIKIIIVRIVTGERKKGTLDGMRDLKIKIGNTTEA